MWNFFKYLFVKHTWVAEGDYMTCTVCNRVEECEEYDDPHGAVTMINVIKRGDRGLHVKQANPERRQSGLTTSDLTK